MSATGSLTYEQACKEHRWQVPERYNIAADVCDRQPGERTAMVFEDFRGNRREVSWAEPRTLANQAASRSRCSTATRGSSIGSATPSRG